MDELIIVIFGQKSAEPRSSMADIRRKSIKATTWIYVGFAIGALNTYFLTHRDWFTTDQNGLTRAMIETSQLIFAFSSLGSTTFLYKFFPYYADNLESKKNDLLFVALVISLIGFVLTMTGLHFLKPTIVRKFSANSLLYVEYFSWIIPMGFFVLLYNILESYAYGFEKGVLTSFLKEAVLRFYTCVIIVLKVFGLIDFKTFVILFAFQYALIVLVLLIHLYKHRQLWFSMKPSRVTWKFRKKIGLVMTLTFIVIIVGVIRQSIDGLVLAAKQNLGKVGIFGLASYVASVMQAPFRSMTAITLPILSRAWKDKNHAEINRIYQRSSINLLSFALFMFLLIWMNFRDAIGLLNINPEYLEGEWVFFMLGMVTIIELGTGVNGQIIGTSTYWRFELWTSLLLTAMIIPLSYTLTVHYGLVGPAIANLVSFTVYNAIRFGFLWKKFHMQPFSMKTLEILLIACLSYLIAWLASEPFTAITGMLIRSLLFTAIFLTGMIKRNVSPDAKPVFNHLIRRLTFKK